MERRRDGGDSGGDIPTEHDEPLDGPDEDSIDDALALYVGVYFPVLDFVLLSPVRPL